MATHIKPGVYMIPPHWQEYIQRLADNRGCDYPDIVLEAIVEHFQNHWQEANKKEQTSG